MTQIQSSISSKYQTVVPQVIRSALNLKAGDRVLWQLVNLGKVKKVIAEPVPKSWAAYSRGLGKSIWRKVGIEDYIQNIRSEWEC